MPEDEKYDPARQSTDKLVDYLESAIATRALVQRHLDRFGHPYEPVPDEGVAIILNKKEAEGARLALSNALTIMENLIKTAPYEALLKLFGRGVEWAEKRREKPGG